MLKGVQEILLLPLLPFPKKWKKDVVSYVIKTTCKKCPDHISQTWKSEVQHRRTSPATFVVNSVSNARSPEAPGTSQLALDPPGAAETTTPEVRIEYL